MLYGFCRSFIENRLNRIKSNIKEVQESLTSETKSSAGDKHETGRAMLQLEREKLGQQLAEAEKIAQILAKVPLTDSIKTIRLGSYVKTTMGNYYVAISAGAFQIEGDSVYCISPDTPIGQLLMAKSVGDHFNFRGDDVTILELA